MGLSHYRVISKARITPHKALITLLTQSHDPPSIQVPTAETADIWRAWSDALGSEEEVLKKQLAPALDFAPRLKPSPAVVLPGAFESLEAFRGHFRC